LHFTLDSIRCSIHDLLLFCRMSSAVTFTLSLHDALPICHARLALIDFQYHDIDPDRGLHNRLVSKGAMRRLTTDEQIEHAVVTPPESTRAWARGRFIAEIGDRVVAAGWDHVVVTDSRGRTRHVDLTDPFPGNKPYCEAHPDFLTPDGPDFLTADGPAVH